MPTSTITVTQNHSLGVEKAIARLNELDKPSLFSVLSSMIATFKLTEVRVKFVIEMPGPNVTGSVLIGPDRVTFVTEPVSQVVHWLAEGPIERTLAEALK